MILAPINPPKQVIDPIIAQRPYLYEKYENCETKYAVPIPIET